MILNLVTIADMKKTILAVAFASALALSACSSNSGDSRSDGALNVTTSFYPLTFLAQEIGGDNVKITDLTPPGADAHGVELSPREVADMEESDLVIYVDKLSPAIDDAIAAADVKAVNIGEYVNLLPYEELGGDPHAHDHDHDDHAEEGDDHGHAHEGQDHDEEGDGHEHDEEGDGHEHEHDDHGHDHAHDHGTHDPHFWTDPSRMMLAADQVTAELIQLNPENEATYTANRDAVKEELQKLVDELDTFSDAQCRTNAFMVSHRAFAYMAQEGEIVELGIAGFDPDVEPSPARVKEVTDLAAEHDLDTVFATSDGEMKMTQAIADEANLKADVLDPAATQRNPDLNYIDVMERNFELLKESMGC